MSDRPTSLPPDVAVIRVLRAGIHVPPGTKVPTWEAFNPSSADKEYAETTGRPVMVSVWDSRKTTPEQALAMRRSGDDLQAYNLMVQDVHDVGTACDNARMRVVPDPDGAPDQSLPGADGHAGIEGLERPEGMAKTLWKKTLSMLAERCKPCHA